MLFNKTSENKLSNDDHIIKHNSSWSPAFGSGLTVLAGERCRDTCL
jgi:hypothetical protein